MNNDCNRPANSGSRSAELSKKVISNLRFSESTVWNSGNGITTRTIYDTPQVFDSNEVAIVKIGDDIYEGNIDTLLSSDRGEGSYFAFGTPATLNSVGTVNITDDKVITEFDSISWWKTWSNRIDGADDLDYKDIVKIDHHPKEDIIGTADFTSSDYSSTCEMVANLIYETKLVMDKDIAEKLFLGIVSDSERFLFKNTTVGTFEMVAKLCKDYNLDFTNLYANLYQKSFNECKFEAYIINNLIITDNKFGYILIDNKVVEEYKVDLSTASVLINNFNFIEELNVWCFITYDERNEIYKVNIRSRGPIINEVASKYNGGGHQYASGVRISEKKDVDALIKDLDEVASNYLAEEQN